ncbi:MAG: hypothetical protein NT010_07460 [Proteobacteria bacterium]|nr:hypothetical protein [Pseudomonadota bacterium]
MKKLILIAVMILGIATLAQAAITSTTFDKNLEGWSAIEDGVISYSEAGGSGGGGGFAQMQDLAYGSWATYAAPASFLGNRLSDFNGSISFDVKRIDGNGTGYAPTVDLISGSTTLTHVFTQFPTQAWNTYTVSLVGSEWGVTDEALKNVLTSLNGFHIRGEYRDGPEYNGLDNVMFGKAAPVPLPSALYLLAPGLLGLAGIKRKVSGITIN